MKRAWPQIARATLKCAQVWWTSTKTGKPTSAIATMEMPPSIQERPIAEGVDNNCDGIISEEEAVACLLDLDGDLAVTVSDVLTLLSEFDAPKIATTMSAEMVWSALRTSWRCLEGMA